MWLWDGEAKNRLFYKEDRPDQSGVIFDLTENDHPAAIAIGRPIMVARPVREGALDTPLGIQLLNKFLDRGMVVALVRGPMSYEFLAHNKRDAEIVATVYEDLPKFKVVK
jgi:hypothetical protein